MFPRKPFIVIWLGSHSSQLPARILLQNDLVIFHDPTSRFGTIALLLPTFLGASARCNSCGGGLMLVSPYPYVRYTVRTYSHICGVNQGRREATAERRKRRKASLARLCWAVVGYCKKAI